MTRTVTLIGGPCDGAKAEADADEEYLTVAVVMSGGEQHHRYLVRGDKATYQGPEWYEPKQP